MGFIDSLDIANKAAQHLGVDPILDVSEDSERNKELSNAYDKDRRTELRRNVWRFAIRKAVLRPLDDNTLLFVPATYDATKTYLVGDIVQDTNDVHWMSQSAANVNNSPGGNNEDWDVYFGPITADEWDDSTTYFAGELVYVVTGTTPNGYQVYMSLVNSNEDTPGTATAYSATVQYKQDDVVLSGGYQWRSLLPVNIGNTPAVGPTAYSATTAYTVGQQVTGSDNYIYTAVGSTTGSDPTTDAGVHWTNTTTLNAWSRSPTLLTSSVKWRPIIGTLANVIPVYPIGAGPSSQSGTRNVFRLPAGYLRPAPQNPKGQRNPVLGGPTGQGYDDWEYEGNFIVSSQGGPIVFRFVADHTIVRTMDDMFCEGLACRNATSTCVRLTQSSTKLADIASKYKVFMGEARMMNAIETGAEDPPEDEYITVRQ